MTNISCTLNYAAWSMPTKAEEDPAWNVKSSSETKVIAVN